MRDFLSIFSVIASFLSMTSNRLEFDDIYINSCVVQTQIIKII